MQNESIKFLESNPLEIAFTDKKMTAYGGFTLLAKLFEKIKLKEAIEEIIPFTETSPNSTGCYAKILRLGLTVLTGGTRYTHSIFLGGSQEIYEKLFSVEKIPKSISAVTRFFSKFVSWQMNEKFSDKLWSYIFDTVIPVNEIKEDILTFDSSVITRFGLQEGSEKGYNPKRKGRASHHPILAFLNNSKYVVNLWNRPGSTTSGNGIIEFTKQTLNRLDNKIKCTKIMADSGFYDINYIKYLESINIEYIIAAKMYRSLQDAIYGLDNWEKVDDGIWACSIEFIHNDAKWDKKRRYIIIRQEKGKTKKEAKGKQLSLFGDDEQIENYRYSAFITSSSDSALNIWRKYRLRAADENIIKENKEYFGFEGFCHKGFYATEASMLIRILFYNIINLFRAKFLPKEESSKSMGSLRFLYFVRPAILGKNGRKPILRIGDTDRFYRQKIHLIFKRIERLKPKRIAFKGNKPVPQVSKGEIF